MDDPSDGQLLDAWTGGDARAFEALVDRHQSALLRYSGALLGSGRGAEDAVQEVLLRLMEKPPDVLPSARGDAEKERAVLRAWLFTTTKRICMDATRSQTRRSHREEAVAPREATKYDVDAVEGADTRAAVEASLERLPEKQREALTLRLFGELSYKDIGLVMDEKIGTVGWLISVGMKALQRELAPLIGMEPADADGTRLTPAKSLQGGLS